jgi:hypothetical protein
MTLTEERQKDPRKVHGGRKGARLRWGPQRVLRLDGLTSEQVEHVIRYVEAMRAGFVTLRGD